MNTSHDMLAWSTEEITHKVIESADRFGGANPQQLKQLAFVLAKYADAHVFEGLMAVFRNGENVWCRHELAGRLLVLVNPVPPTTWPEALRECLGTYELSVEQLPWYLAGRVGRRVLTETLDTLACEVKTEKELRAVDTMRFWTRNGA